MLHKTLFLLMSLMVSSLQAMEFSLEALFPGKAMINLDGKRMILKAGQEKKGILLISTDTYSQTAEFEIE